MTTVAPTPETTFHTFTLPAPNAVRPRVFLPRKQMTTAMLAAEATTYGWDTVNCIRLPLVNQVLASSEKYPKNLQMTLNSDERWTIDTSYGAWQIAPGGSGAILMMKLPLTEATLTYGTNSLSFQNGWVLISLKLRYVPQNSTRFSASNKNPIDIEKLIADARARSPDDPPVVVQRVSYGNVTPTDQQKALFEASIALLLNKNLDKFAHVFAVVNLNQKATTAEFYWLKPTYTSYAYFQGVNDDSSYFAVLNQTENRSPEGLTNQVAAAAIPANMNASILISNELFMQQFVMPGLPRAFPRADAEAFKLANGTTIEGTKRVELDPVRVGAIDYTPYLDNFRMQIVGDEIQIQTKVSINISPGIDAYVDAVYFYALGLVEKEDGSVTLDFEPSGQPIITSWYTVAFWVTMTQLLVSIVGAVIGAVVGEAIKNVVAKVIVITLITIVAGVAAAIPSIIADVISNGAAAALPSIGPMLDDATAPVEWPQSSGFSLKTAELNGALQLGGVLAMTTAR